MEQIQHGRGTRTHNEQPTREKATEAVPVWLHQALTDFLQGLPCGTYNKKGQKMALEMALSKSEANKAAEDAAAEEERKCLAEEAVG